MRPRQAWAAWERPLAHAAYWERTLYNAVLGTQRGANPGETTSSNDHQPVHLPLITP